MNSLGITLCLIVKDEKEYVRNCIESIKDHVSDILIADTGSTDNTFSICKNYTNNVEKIDFSKGFSHARNYLLEKVKTKWVLFLDADEYFDLQQVEKLLTYVSQAKDDIDAFSVLRYNFFSNGAFYTSETIKLFRSHPDIRYEGVVVDSVKPSLLKRGNRIKTIPVILNHFGHCRPVTQRDQKAHKYLLMMNEELKANPTNFKVMGYKALILRTLGELQEAQMWSLKALKIAPNNGHPHFVKGHVARAFGDHNESIQSYTRALELDGNNAIYLNSRGIAYLTFGDCASAAKDFDLGLKRFPHYVHFLINLGLVDEARGDFESALKRFSAVGQQYPAFLKTNFLGCSEVDPYSGYIYDTLFNFRGLAYHLSFCLAKVKGSI